MKQRKLGFVKYILALLPVVAIVPALSMSGCSGKSSTSSSPVTAGDAGDASANQPLPAISNDAGYTDATTALEDAGDAATTTSTDSGTTPTPTPTPTPAPTSTTPTPTPTPACSATCTGGGQGECPPNQTAAQATAFTTNACGQITAAGPDFWTFTLPAGSTRLSFSFSGPINITVTVDGSTTNLAPGVNGTLPFVAGAAYTLEVQPETAGQMPAYTMNVQIQ